MPPARKRMRTPVIDDSTRRPAIRRPEPPIRRPPPRPARPIIRERAGSEITVEAAAWLAIAALALAIRLINLDGNPLQPNESAVAMDSWRIVRGDGVPLGASPLLVYANALIFLALGATDGLARAIPMLAGYFAALSPFFLRRELGRVAALAAALILATSPTLIFAARSVDPTSLSLALSLAFVIAVLRYADARQTRYLYVGAVVSALLLMSGPPAYAMLVILVGYLAARWREARLDDAFSAPEGDDVVPFDDVTPDDGIAPVRFGRRLRGLALAFLGTVAVVGTGLGTNFVGFGNSLADPLGRWVTTLGSVTLGSVSVLPMILLGYEPLALVFGIVGAVYAFRGARSIEGFLTWWAGVAALLFLIGDGSNPTWAALIVAPLALLAGRAVAETLPAFTDAETRQRFLIYAVVVCSLLATTLIAVGNATLPDPNVPRWAAAMPVLAIVAFSLGFVVWYDLRSTLASLALVGLIALLGVNVHGSMLLNSGGTLNPAEIFTGTTTSPDVRTLADDVSTTLNELHIARHLEGKPVSETVEVTSAYANPIAWYLRTWPQTQIVAVVDDAPAVVIVSPQAKAPAGPYAGELFQVTSSARRPSLNPIELLRWWLLREPLGQTDNFVKVYIKTQLGAK